MATNNKVKFRDLSQTQQLKARKEMYRRWALSYEENIDMIKVETEIGKKYCLSQRALQALKKKDRWNERLEKRIANNTTQKEVTRNIDKNVPVESKEAITDINKLLHEADIPDRWKVFVMYYLHSYNVGYAAKKAGYTSGRNCSAGFQALQDPRVKVLIKQIKEIMYTDIYITGRDILNEYIKIAFADMTEFVTFDEKKVTLKNSQDVDGRLITEVKQGREGVTIKLADKLKAMEKLEKLFDIIPDRRLELDYKKYELSKQLAEKDNGSGNKVVIINDL